MLQDSVGFLLGGAPHWESSICIPRMGIVLELLIPPAVLTIPERCLSFVNMSIERQNSMIHFVHDEFGAKNWYLIKLELVFDVVKS